MIENLLIASGQVFTFTVLLYVLLGVFIGYLVGALPGMNRATALALLIPFTFNMTPLAALCFLIGVNKGGAAGSAVSAILINVPGEPSSVVTTLDGYPMTQQGKSQKALKIGLFASVAGDIIATFVLILLAVPLAAVAVGIGSVDLSAIIIFAITFIAAVSGESFIKGIISGLLGLMLASVGLDIETGLPRLTFGLIQLYDGIPLLAIAIGTLALSEILVQIDHGWRGNYQYKAEKRKAEKPEDKRLTLTEFRALLPSIFRGSAVGTAIGILPGLGATLSSFLAYTWTRSASKHPEKFGHGAPEGVATAESADNASVPASLIPVFAVGLPGSLATALLMGAFLLHGLTPGPFLFKQDTVLVYGIFVGMIVASLLLLLVGLFGQAFFARIITVRDTIIMPVIVFFCIVGAYLDGGSMFSVYLMLIFGFVGYFMKKMDFSFVTFLVGYILGPMSELRIRQAIILTDANPMALLNHPVAVFFLIAAVVSVWRFSSMHMLKRAGGQKAKKREKDI